MVHNYVPAFPTILDSFYQHHKTYNNDRGGGWGVVDGGEWWGAMKWRVTAEL